MNWAEYLIEYRRARNLSQRELSVIMGVSLRSISRWENDQPPPQTRMQHYFNLLESPRIKGRKMRSPSPRKFLLWQTDYGPVLMDRSLTTLDWIIKQLPNADYVSMADLTNNNNIQGG